MATAQWPDLERVETHIRNHPGRTATLLVQRLDQATLDAIYTAMFPPATAYQRALAMARAKRLLIRAGCATDSTVVQSIEQELAALSAEVEQ